MEDVSLTVIFTCGHSADASAMKRIGSVILSAARGGSSFLENLLRVSRMSSTRSMGMSISFLFIPVFLNGVPSGFLLILWLWIVMTGPVCGLEVTFMTTYSRPVGVSIGKLTLCGSSLRSLSFSRVKYSICCANCCAEKGAETQEGPVVPCSVVSHHVMSPAVLGGLLRGLAGVIARRFLGLCPSGSSFWSGTWNGAGVSGRLGVGVFGRTDLSNWGSSLSDLCSGISSGMSSHFMHS